MALPLCRSSKILQTYIIFVQRIYNNSESMMTNAITTSYMFVDAALVPVDKPNIDSHLTYTMKIINTTDQDIHVVGRDGLTHTLKPSINNGRDHGSIEILYGVLSDESHVIFDSKKQLNAVHDKEVPLYDSMRETMHNEGLLYHGRSNRSCLYRLYKKDIAKAGGSVYIRQLDLCISLGALSTVPPHPYGPEGVANYHIDSCRAFLEEGSFGYTMKLVDNRKMMDDRFVNVSGQVYRVPVVEDANMSDGLYITYIGKADDVSNRTTPRTEYYPLETLQTTCPFVYKSIEDATHYGDVLARMDEDLKRKKLEWEERSNELKQKQDEWKFSQARDIDEQKREAEKLAHQQKLLEQERANFYESKSYARKDSTELWKMIPVVIAGLIAVKTLWK